MAVIVDRPRRYGSQSVTINGNTTVNPNVAIGLRGWVQVRDSPYPRKQPGFKYPTPYVKYGTNDNGDGLENVFATYHHKNGTRATRFGVDNGNTVYCDLSSFDETVANKAITSARLKMKNQKVNFGQAFAERQQTINLVADTAKRISKGIHAAKRGDIRGIVKSLGIVDYKPSRKTRKLAARIRRGHKSGRPADLSRTTDVHNLWLQHQFGWKPLLSDVSGAAELLAEKDTQDPKRYEFSCKAGASSKTEIRYQRDGQAFSNTCGAWESFYELRVFKAFVRFDMYLDNPYLQTLASTGITNPVSLAWELVPFSFVVDWFLPIGKFLDCLDASVGWSFRAGSISRKMEGKATKRLSTPRNKTELASYHSISVGGGGTATAFDLRRSVYYSFPLPTSICPKNPLSTTHLLDGLALLKQAVGR